MEIRHLCMSHRAIGNSMLSSAAKACSAAEPSRKTRKRSLGANGISLLRTPYSEYLPRVTKGRIG